MICVLRSDVVVLFWFSCCFAGGCYCLLWFALLVVLLVGLVTFAIGLLIWFVVVCGLRLVVLVLLFCYCRLVD